MFRQTACLLFLLLSAGGAWAQNNAQFLSQTVPSAMTAGQPYAVAVTFKNIGTTTWSAGSNYRLGPQNPQDSTTWLPPESINGIQTNRVYLPATTSVAPGQTFTFNFTVTAPSAPGTYNFRWRMLQENVEWFGEVSTNVPVAVNPVPFLLNDNDSSIAYLGTWNISLGRGLGDYQNDVHYTTQDNDEFRYTFNGTGINWVTETNTDEGAADVYLDDILQQTVSAFSNPRQVQQTVWSKTGLTPSFHTLRVIKRSGQYLLLDALRVYASSPQVQNSGFEAPALGPGGYQYNPPDGSWAFLGGSGVTRDGSGFTNGNPNAPEGLQVGFVQNDGTLSQSLSGWQTGKSYRLTFLAAQRANVQTGPQTVEVFLDNISLGQFTPPSASYTAQSTAAFTTTAGTHTLKFMGLYATGDHTAFLDQVQLLTDINVTSGDSGITIADVTAGTGAVPAQAVARFPSYSDSGVPWIAPVVDTGTGYAASASAGHNYLFAFPFTLPSSGGPFPLSGQLLSDNNLLSIYVDAPANALTLNPAQTSGQQNQDVPDSFQIPLSFSSLVNGGGAHTLYVLVHNQDANGSYNPVALTLTALVSGAGGAAPVSLDSLSVTPGSVVGAQSSTGTATLTGAAPAGGMVVSLQSNSGAAMVPASVTVASGATSATFSISTIAVGSDTTVTLSGTGGGATRSASLLVQAPTLTNLTLAPATVAGGTSSTGTVTLSSAAPAGGLSVTLSSNQGAASPPTSVSVPAGASSTTFTVTTTPVSSQTTASLTGTLNGVSRSATLTITSPQLTNLTVSPSTVTGGQGSTGTVTLFSAAPTGGMSVSLSSNQTAATVPATVTVAAGATTATFPITTSSVQAQTVATLTASLNGTTRTASLTLTVANCLYSLSVNPTSTPGGTPVQGVVTLTAPAPSGGLEVALSSSNPALVQVPGSITIAAGQTAASFLIATRDLAAAQTVTLTATVPCGNRTATIEVTPQTLTCNGSPLVSLSLSPTSLIGGASSTGTVTLAAQAITGGQFVQLTSNSPSALVEAIVFVPQGQTQATFTVSTHAVGQTTTATITASYAGVFCPATLTLTPGIASGSSILHSSGGNARNGAGPGDGNKALAKDRSPQTANPLMDPMPTFLGPLIPLDALQKTGASARPLAHALGAALDIRSANAAGGGQDFLTFGQCGPIDVVFIVDDSGSMQPCLDSIKSTLSTIVGDIQIASGNDYRLALVSVSDDVVVRQTLATSNADAFIQNVRALAEHGGLAGDEPIDEGLNTVLNNLPAHSFGGNYTGQINDFDTPFRANARKLVIMVTDEPPGGENHHYTDGGQYQYTHDISVKFKRMGALAAAKGIQVSVVEVALNDSNTFPPDLVNIWTSIAETSGGEYSVAPRNGVGIDFAIDAAIRRCGGYGTSQIVYTRDDRTLPHTPLQLTNPAVVGISAKPATFDLSGVAVGHVTGAHMARRGVYQRVVQANTGFDLLWGVQSATDSSLVSFGDLVVGAQRFPDNYSYQHGWFLPERSSNLGAPSLLKEIEDARGLWYSLLLVDRLSSVCGPYSLTDTPQANAPQERNVLTFLVSPYRVIQIPALDASEDQPFQTIPVRSRPAIPQGSLLDLTLPGSERPEFGEWEIRLEGVVLASSGDPRGWNVAFDHTVYRGVWVNAPADAPIAESYQVRFVGMDDAGQQVAGSGAFDVTGPNADPPSGNAASVLSLNFAPNPVMGGNATTGTLTLSAPAPPGGAAIALRSAHPSLVAVPDSLVVAQGQTQKTFAATTANVDGLSLAPWVDVFAAYNGVRSASVLVLGTQTGVIGAPILSAVAGNQSVLLSWTPAVAAPGRGPVRYAVKRALSHGGPYISLFTGLPGTTYRDTTVRNGVTYFYVVAGADGYGPGPNSNEVSATPWGGQVATPVITPNGGTIYGSVPGSITLTCATRGALIRYTLNGATPTDSSPVYAGPFTPGLPSGTTFTLKARGFKVGWLPSATASASFTLSGGGPPDGQIPTIEIIQPTANTSFTAGQAISIMAQVSDPRPGGSIQKVEFYANAQKLGETSTGNPYNFVWNGASPGTYDLRAVAFDSSGSIATSAPVRISVLDANGALPLPCGTPVQGELMPNDPVSILVTDGTHYRDRYTFTAQAGEKVTLLLHSASFDTLLLLIKPDGTVLFNDNEGLSTNSRLVYDVTQTGVYTVEVTSSPAGQTGDYELTLLCPTTAALPDLHLFTEEKDMQTGSAFWQERQPGDTVEFGVTPTSVPVSKRFRVRNDGAQMLFVDGIDIGAGDFRFLQLPQSQVPPGGETTFAVQFNASTPHSDTSSLSVQSNSALRNPFPLVLHAVAASSNVSLQSLTINPSSVNAGQTATGTLTLSGPAPQGGFSVQVTSNKNAVVQPPATVVIPTGAQSHTFSILTQAVAQATTAPLTAAAPGSTSQTATLLVNPSGLPPSVSLSLNSASFTATAAIPMTAVATANEPGSFIRRVELFQGDSKIGEATQPSSGNLWTFTWRGVEAGSYSLKARATDSGGRVGESSAVIVTVDARPQVATPTITLQGQDASVSTFTDSATVVISGSTPGATYFYTLDGSDPTPSALRYTTPFSLGRSATVKARGYKVNYDASAVASRLLTRTGSSAGALTVRIISPADSNTQTGLSILTAPQMIRGSFNGPGQWQLEWHLVGEANWVPFAAGAITGSEQDLARFDPTLLLNGVYEIQLRGIQLDGAEVPPAIITVAVEGNLKLGQFSFSVVDMTVPVAGMPIQVVRTYDSRDKRAGDFGQGWTLSLTNVRSQKLGAGSDNHIGREWHTQGSGGNRQVVSYGTRALVVTLPDGQMLAWVPGVQMTFGQPYGQVTWYPASRAARRVKLEPNDGGGLVYTYGGDSDLYTLDEDLTAGSEVYDVSGFKVALRNGTQLEVDANGKIQRITDRSGNVTDFTDAARIATFAPGQSTPLKQITITHGAGGVITQITDPRGNHVDYQQSGGLLTAVTNRVRETTRYAYDYQGNLTDIVTPSGRTPVHNQYAPDGRIAATTDAFGKAVGYDYTQADVAGSRKVTVTDRKNSSTQISFDGQGSVTATAQSVTRYNAAGAAAGVETITVSSVYGDALNPDKPTVVRDGRSKETHYEYTEEGDLKTARDPKGNLTEYQYDGYGDVEKVIGPELKVLSETVYDAKGNPTVQRDALGHETRTAYVPAGTNGVGQLQSVQDAKGKVTQFKYDNLGNQTQVMDALGSVTQFAYDENGNRTGVQRYRTRAGGTVETIVSQTVFDEEDRPSASLSPTGVRSETQYDADGRVGATKDTQGQVTRYTYNAQGQRIRTLLPNGNSTQTQYDDNARAYLSISTDGTKNEAIYDESGAIVGSKQYDANGSALSFTVKHYDAAGRVDWTRDGRGQIVNFEFDENGNQTRVFGATPEVKTTYDGYNRPLTITDALNRATTNVYDPVGRVIETDYADGTHSSTGYDELGRRISETNEMGETTSFGYDEVGRLVSVTDPLGHVTTYGYDEAGNRISQTDAKGRTTRFSYDASGRQIGKKLPGGQVYSWNYEGANGRLLSTLDWSDAAGTTPGYQTVLSYDGLGRMTGKASGTQSIGFDYDGLGRRWKTYRNNNLTGQQTFEAATGRLQGVAEPAGSVTYGYNALGDKTALTTPTGASQSEYDPQGRLWKLHHKDSTVTEYGYDAAGQLAIETRPNGLVTRYSYDLRGRVLRVQHDMGSIMAPKLAYTYLYDAAGRRTGITETGSSGNGLSVSYTYDAGGRLTGETYSSGRAITYGYDAVGNRFSKTDSADPLFGNQASSYAYLYDAAGNDRLMQVNRNGAVYKTYAYDNAGRVTILNGAAVGWTFDEKVASIGNVSFGYDADGNRVSKSGTTSSTFLVDPTAPFAQVVEETTGGQTTRYDLGLDVMRQDKTGGAVSYSLVDALGSVRRLANASGTVTEGQAYLDAFGLPGSWTGTQAFALNGQQFDSETGLYFLRARYYDPESGRFLSQDSEDGELSKPVTLHRYIYGGDGPAGYADPGGQEFSLIGTSISSSIATSFASVKSSVDIQILQSVADIFGYDFSIEELASILLREGAGVKISADTIRRIEFYLVAFQVSRWGFSKLRNGIRSWRARNSISFADDISLHLGSDGCFIGETPVALSDGIFQNIQNLPAKSFLLSRKSTDMNAKVVASKARFKSERTVYETVTISVADTKTGKTLEQITGTRHHPFYTVSGWVEMQCLGIGTQIVTRAGPAVVVKAVHFSYYPSGIKVYNFDVADTQTYFVGKSYGGLWVHNGIPCGLSENEVGALQRAEANLPSIRGSRDFKTDAADAFGNVLSSGPTQRKSRGNLNSAELTKRVKELTEQLGMTPIRLQGGNDNGDPGSFFASHSEKQMAVYHYDHGLDGRFAFRKNGDPAMCENCIDWMKQFSENTGKRFVIYSPNEDRTYVFDPTGTTIVDGKL